MLKSPLKKRHAPAQEQPPTSTVNLLYLLGQVLLLTVFIYFVISATWRF